MIPVRSMADRWKEYLEVVVHQAAGPEQIRETKAAFYAGAQSVFWALHELAHGVQDVDIGAAAAAALERECFEFLSSKYEHLL